MEMDKTMGTLISMGMLPTGRTTSAITDTICTVTTTVTVTVTIMFTVAVTRHDCSQYVWRSHTLLDFWRGADWRETHTNAPKDSGGMRREGWDCV